MNEKISGGEALRRFRALGKRPGWRKRWRERLQPLKTAEGRWVGTAFLGTAALQAFIWWRDVPTGFHPNGWTLGDYWLTAFASACIAASLIAKVRDDVYKVFYDEDGNPHPSLDLTNVVWGARVAIDRTPQSLVFGAVLFGGLMALVVAKGFAFVLYLVLYAVVHLVTASLVA